MAANGESNLLIKIKESGKEALKDIGSGLDEIKLKAAAVSAVLTGFIGLSVKNYAEAEEANNALTQSIINQGLNVDKLAKKYDLIAKKIEEKSVFDDDQIKMGMSLAQNYMGQIELT